MPRNATATNYPAKDKQRRGVKSSFQKKLPIKSPAAAGLTATPLSPAEDSELYNSTLNATICQEHTHSHSQPFRVFSFAEALCKVSNGMLSYVSLGRASFQLSSGSLTGMQRILGEESKQFHFGTGISTD